MIAVEHQEIGAGARLQRADRPPEGGGAAGQGGPPQAGADRAAVAHRGDVALLAGQALAVFQPAQLLQGADRDMAVGADAEGAARRQIGGQREQPVAQVGLGGRAEPGDGARAGQGQGLLAGHVGGVDEAPAP